MSATTQPSPAASGHAARALIERCFAGTLAPAEWDELFAHLRGCPACHDQFERTRAAFRALGGPPAAAPRLARAEADLIREALLPPPRPARRWAPLAALALAGGLGLALLVVRPAHQHDAGDGFAERGAVVTRAGFDVLCVPPDEAAPPTSASAAGGRCAPGSFLKAVVTRPDPALPHVLVVALEPGFRMRASLRAQASGTERVFAPGHTRLGSGEALVLVAILARQPVSDAAVTEAVTRARKSGTALGELSGLPLADTAQLVVRVQAEAGDAR
jgi:hypothetical protein